MDWSDLKYLLALKRAGSLAGAARALKVDDSTVSRRLAGLEEALGTQLFRRTPDGLVFTSAGCAASETAAAMELQVAQLERAVGGGDDTEGGTVKLTFPEGLMPHLVNVVAALKATHPDLHLELHSAIRALDLVRGEADVALRPFRGTQAGLVARKVGTLGWGLYASEEYIARKGLPSADALGCHEIIGYQESLRGTPGQQWLDLHAASSRVAMRGNDTHSVALATAQGLGVSTLPCFLAGSYPGLRRLTPGVIGRADLFAVMPEDLQHQQRIRAVVEALVAYFRKEAVLFAGPD